MVSSIGVSTFFIILFFLTKVFGMSPNMTACPVMCRCARNTYVTCQGTEDQKLKFIPKLPETTRQLVFTGNILTEVYQDTFQNITFQYGARIEVLDLSNNGILTISTMAFSKLTYLKELTLNKNYLRDPDGLQKALVGLKYINIHKLTLQQMQIADECVPINLFEPLTYRNTIQKIDMSNNILNEFDFQTLTNLTHLEEFTLSGNRISGLTFESHDITNRKLKHLDVRSNNILAMPFLCMHQQSMFPALTNLEMDDNFITYLDPEDFNCLTHVKHLSLNANPVTMIPSNLIEEMTSLEELQMNSMLRVPVKIAYGAFTSNSLKTLRLAGNEFDSTVFTVNGFNGLNQIETLDLSGSEFQNLTKYPEDLLISFIPTSVEELSLRNSMLVGVPRFNSSTLTELDLSDNKITELKSEDITGYPSIRILNLNSNRLTKISAEAITRKIQDQLVAVGLADNPFLCSCEIAWLHDWMVREPLKFLTLGTHVVCINQETGAFMLLENYKPTGCGDGNSRTLTISIVSSIVVLIFTIILLVCYRKRIKLFCYICTRRRGGEQLVLNDGQGI